MGRFGVETQVVAPNPPNSFVAVANSTTETSLFGVGSPSFAEVPQHSGDVGNAFLLRCGGVFGTKAAATGTLTFKTYWGNDDALGAGNQALGSSPALTPTASLTNASWYLETMVVIVSLDNPAVTFWATGRNHGFVMLDANMSSSWRTAGTFLQNGTEATDEGIIVTAKWSTADALNTIQTTWMHLIGLN